MAELQEELNSGEEGEVEVEGEEGEEESEVR